MPCLGYLTRVDVQCELNMEHLQMEITDMKTTLLDYYDDSAEKAVVYERRGVNELSKKIESKLDNHIANLVQTVSSHI